MKRKTQTHENITLVYFISHLLAVGLVLFAYLSTYLVDFAAL